MIKRVSKDKFKNTYQFYKIWGNDKFVITKLYPDGFTTNYLRDLIECFKLIISSFIGIICFPIYLILTLISFIPRIVINCETD